MDTRRILTSVLSDSYWTRRSTSRYWTLIGPFAGYLLGTVLDTVTADLERTMIAVK